jgi:CubicO group peptidase (beta-lactamase class C family)
MKRIFPAACGLLVLVVLAGFSAESGATRSSGPTAASVDAKLQAIWTKYKSQLRGLCVGASDDGINRIKCFGKKTPGTVSVTPDQHTLFHIASISKTFGATLLALRVVQGKVHLEDPVRDYVPHLAERVLFPKKGLTLLDLADHYSGLRHGTPKGISVDDFLLKTGNCLHDSTCFIHPPEVKYSYSNWAVSVLGTLLAVNDGFPDGPIGPWSADNRHAITGPLGMTETRSTQDWLKNDPATFQAQQAGTGSEKFNQNPYESPGTGVWSSPHDMLIWLRYSMGLAGSGDLKAAVPLLYEDTDHMRPAKRAPQQIGLVWTITPGTGASCVSKAGDGGDFHAFFDFVDRKTEAPGDKQRRGVFLLVNKTPTTTSYRAIAAELLNSLPGKPGEQKAQCTIPGSSTTDDG